MGYSKDVYAKAEERLSRRRQKAFYDAENRREQIYRKIPRAKEIETLLAKTGISAAKTVLAGGDTKSELIKLRDNNLKLQGELKVLLVQNGYTTADLEEQYFCQQCRDYGYVDGKMCSCMKRLLREISYEELNSLSPLSLSSFDTFDLGYYSGKPDDNNKIPRTRLTNIFNYCKKYAEEFCGFGKSILMEGGTGLGKTHLSLAIAQRVIERGYGVVYCSAPDILNVLEREHFSRTAKNETLHRLNECDLLIIDDLGTEFSTQFTQSCIYNLINTRISQEKPTIVNTNLSLTELKKLYSERFVSRFIGDQCYFEFIGDDVRIIKRRLQQNNLTN